MAPKKALVKAFLLAAGALVANPPERGRDKERREGEGERGEEGEGERESERGMEREEEGRERG